MNGNNLNKHTVLAAFCLILMPVVLSGILSKLGLLLISVVP